MMIEKQDFPVALTFDIDWAPDFVIESCVEILKTHAIPATFFATHQSSILNDLRSDEMFEVGIHPNFLAGTTHGRTQEEIMDTVISLVPDASLMRTHGLFQTSNLFFLLLEKYAQIKCDFSLFLPGNRVLNPFKYIDDKGRFIMRVPYQWEDDFYFIKPPYNEFFRGDEIIFDSATYQVFDFHPIHVYLNSESPSHYNELKQKLKKPLSQATIEDLQDFRNSNQVGTANWLLYIIETIPKSRFVHASRVPCLI